MMGTMIKTAGVVVLAAVLIAVIPRFTPAAGYDIDQTLSDEAQATTIAFDGLAFLTGDLCGDSFLPPGKIADFFGFQYLRDNDPGGDGHTNEFLSRIANNVLFILTDDQVSQVIDLARTQVADINLYAYQRFPLMKAFRRLLEGDLPNGSSGLSEAAVIEYSADLYHLDGRISLDRARLLGGLISGLDQGQRAYLDDLAKVGWADWPEVGDQVDKQSMDHDTHVAVMTYASQFFSWYAGSVEADVYFCPERQGTYFGSFYLKDAPLMGNPGYAVDPNLTANMGRAFLAALPDAEADRIRSLVETQRADLLEIVSTREAISRELRKLMAGEEAGGDVVLNLARKYGELDGRIVYWYANAFTRVNRNLSEAQKADLAALREPVDFPCSGAYLYSEPIPMPEVGDTDFLLEGGE